MKLNSGWTDWKVVKDRNFAEIKLAYIAIYSRLLFNVSTLHVLMRVKYIVKRPSC